MSSRSTFRGNFERDRREFRSRLERILRHVQSIKDRKTTEALSLSELTSEIDVLDLAERLGFSQLPLVQVDRNAEAASASGACAGDRDSLQAALEELRASLRKPIPKEEVEEFLWHGPQGTGSGRLAIEFGATLLLSRIGSSAFDSRTHQLEKLLAVISSWTHTLDLMVEPLIYPCMPGSVDVSLDLDFVRDPFWRCCKMGEIYFHGRILQLRAPDKIGAWASKLNSLASYEGIVAMPILGDYQEDDGRHSGVWLLPPEAGQEVLLNGADGKLNEDQNSRVAIVIERWAKWREANLRGIPFSAFTDVVEIATPAGHGKRKRGRPRQRPTQEDWRIRAAWKTKHHTTYASLAKALNIPVIEVQRALERTRNRQRGSKPG